MAKAEPKTDGVMLFHRHCSDMVHVSTDRDKACTLLANDFRLRSCPVFSEVPMEMGRLYEEPKRREYLLNILQDSRVGLALDRERTLHLFFNGQNMGVIAREIPSPCYFMFMFDVFLWVEQIAALPITIIDELNQEPKQKTLSESAQSPTSVTTPRGQTESL